MRSTSLRSIPTRAHVPQMLGEIKRFRATMQKHGDGHKPLWITEIGWGSLPKDATPFGLTKGKKGQARILKHAFHALKKKRRSWHIKRVLWFNFRDPGGGNVKTCSFCSSAGLLEHDAHAETGLERIPQLHPVVARPPGGSSEVP